MKVVLPIVGTVSFAAIFAFVITLVKSKTIHSAVGRMIGTKTANHLANVCPCGVGLDQPWQAHHVYCEVYSRGYNAFNQSMPNNQLGDQ